MSQTVIKPEDVKRHRTYEEWKADRRFYRWLGWGTAIVIAAAIVAIVWIVMAASTEPVGVVDPFPTESVWGSK